MIPSNSDSCVATDLLLFPAQRTAGDSSENPTQMIKALRQTEWHNIRTAVQITALFAME